MCFCIFPSETRGTQSRWLHRWVFWEENTSALFCDHCQSLFQVFAVSATKPTREPHDADCIFAVSPAWTDMTDQHTSMKKPWSCICPVLCSSPSSSSSSYSFSWVLFLRNSSVTGQHTVYCISFFILRLHRSVLIRWMLTIGIILKRWMLILAISENFSNEYYCLNLRMNHTQ